MDNRPGGNGNIGMEIVAQSRPDGHTLVLGYIANLAIAPSLYGKLAFDPVKDFAPVTQLASSPNATAWYGVLAPANTPRSVITRLHGEFVRILKLPLTGDECRNTRAPSGSIKWS